MSTLQEDAGEADLAAGAAADRGRGALELGLARGVPVLAAAMGDDEVLIRGDAAWPRGRIGSAVGSPPEVALTRTGAIEVRSAPEADE